MRAVACGFATSEVSARFTGEGVAASHAGSANDAWLADPTETLGTFRDAAP
jgi:hypothetical protein